MDTLDETQPMTGTPEYKTCADWVGTKFAQWGIVPGGDGLIYLRSLHNPNSIVFVGGELTFGTVSGDKPNGKK